MNLINNRFNDIGQIQKIYSSATTIDISIRFPGNTQHLYIGRGGGVEGVWAGQLRIPSQLRKIDKFLEYLRSYLSGCTFQKLEMDSFDRCLAIKYGRHGKLCSLLLFYAGRDLYFANHYFDDKSQKMLLFKSWENKTYKLDHDDLFTIFDDVGRINIDKNNEIKNIDSIEDILNQELKKIENSHFNKKQEKFVNRKIEKIALDLKRIEKSEDLIALASDYEKDFSALNKKENIFGIRFNFEGNTHFQRRDEIFQKAKRLKKNQALLISRLNETKALLTNKNQPIEYENPLNCISPVWKIKKEKTITENKNEQEYLTISLNNIDYAIGTSASGNDQMRKMWAKKDDIWFHYESGVSPHVIVKLNGKVLNQEVFEQVAKLILKVTKESKNELDLIYTQVKNLKGVTGTKGKVTYKKEKHIRIRL